MVGCLQPGRGFNTHPDGHAFASCSNEPLSQIGIAEIIRRPQNLAAGGNGLNPLGQQIPQEAGLVGSSKEYPCQRNLFCLPESNDADVCRRITVSVNWRKRRFQQRMDSARVLVGKIVAIASDLGPAYFVALGISRISWPQAIADVLKELLPFARAHVFDRSEVDTLIKLVCRRFLPDEIKNRV